MVTNLNKTITDAGGWGNLSPADRKELRRQWNENATQLTARYGRNESLPFPAFGADGMKTVAQQNTEIRGGDVKADNTRADRKLNFDQDMESRKQSFREFEGYRRLEQADARLANSIAGGSASLTDINKKVTTLRTQQVGIRAKLDSYQKQLDAMEFSNAVIPGSNKDSQTERDSEMNKIRNAMNTLRTQNSGIEAQLKFLAEQRGEVASSSVPAGPTGGNFDIARSVASEVFGQKPHLVELFTRLVSAESGGIDGRTSSAGAFGLAQLMPATARELAKKYGGNPKRPEDNLRLGALYLRDQLTAFGGNFALALAAYNAGPGAVRKYGGIPPFKETQDYVRKILGQDALDQNQGKGGGKAARPASASAKAARPASSTKPAAKATGQSRASQAIDILKGN
jgi:hypothetical protein